MLQKLRTMEFISGQPNTGKTQMLLKRLLSNDKSVQHLLYSAEETTESLVNRLYNMEEYWYKELQGKIKTMEGLVTLDMKVKYLETQLVELNKNSIIYLDFNLRPADAAKLLTWFNSDYFKNKYSKDFNISFIITVMEPMYVAETLK